MVFVHDVIVIGAGPAGLMTAGVAAQAGASVALLDSNAAPGKKLSITGNGRCNVTNLCSHEAFLQSVVHNAKFLHSALSAFSPLDTALFFDGQGVPLVTEQNNRAFPNTNKSADIIRALMQPLTKHGVQTFWESAVQSVQKEGDVFAVITANQTLHAKQLVVATGGKSYPGTGCTGFGYTVAKQFGHNVIEPVAALVPIALSGNLHKQLEGISLKNISLLCHHRGKLHKVMQGDLLFTGIGISGPLVLGMSSYMSRLTASELTLQLDWVPHVNATQLDEALQTSFANFPHRSIESVLVAFLPKRASAVFCTHIGIAPETKSHAITKALRMRLVQHLKQLDLCFHKLVNIEAATVTSGGVDIKQINPKTMQSKLVQNLYFAGEVLDVDALTGGFNIQIALSTGYLAGKACGGNL